MKKEQQKLRISYNLFHLFMFQFKNDIFELWLFMTVFNFFYRLQYIRHGQRSLHIVGQNNCYDLILENWPTISNSWILTSFEIYKNCQAFRKLKSVVQLSGLREIEFRKEIYKSVVRNPNAKKELFFHSLLSYFY